jgi:hypothetical protein
MARVAGDGDSNAVIAQLQAQLAQQRLELAVLNAQKNAYRALLETANPTLTTAADTYGLLTYLSDGLATWNKSVSFLALPRFASAYRRGMSSGHRITTAAGTGGNLEIGWRIAICCWAAAHAKHLAGDFVECGTNTGIMSLAICEYVEFDKLAKRFWLFDTFAGIPPEQMSEQERASNAALNEMYFDCYELTRRNFEPFPNAQLVRGRIPESLTAVDIDQVSYLSLDLNIEYPERAALEFFWPKLVPGAIVVFDDYGWLPHHAQRDSHDAFALSQGVEIFTLPTGQGLLVKP